MRTDRANRFERDLFGKKLICINASFLIYLLG